MSFKSFLTNTGIQKLTRGRANGVSVDFIKFKLSSSSITEESESLENIVYEGEFRSKSVDSNNPDVLVLECFLPSSVGGFSINALGIYDRQDDLIALCSIPSTYKPSVDEGSAKELLLRVFLKISNAKEVVLNLNNEAIMASRSEVERVAQQIQLKLPLKADLNGSEEEAFSVSTPTEGSHAINKDFLEEALRGLRGNVGNLLENCVLLQGNQTIRGVKTFNSPPICSPNPSANNHLANKGYVDAVGNSKVPINGNANINGVKTFASAPLCNGTMGNDNQLINLATLKRLTFGFNQSWKYKEYRYEVTYTNTTGRPIIVVCPRIKINNVEISVANSIYRQYSHGETIYQEGTRFDFPFIVPAGATYRFERTLFNRELSVKEFS